MAVDWRGAIEAPGPLAAFDAAPVFLAMPAEATRGSSAPSGFVHQELRTPPSFLQTESTTNSSNDGSALPLTAPVSTPTSEYSVSQDEIDVGDFAFLPQGTPGEVEEAAAAAAEPSPAEEFQPVERISDVLGNSPHPRMDAAVFNFTSHEASDNVFDLHAGLRKYVQGEISLQGAPEAGSLPATATHFEIKLAVLMLIVVMFVILRQKSPVSQGLARVVGHIPVTTADQIGDLLESQGSSGEATLVRLEGEIKSIPGKSCLSAPFSGKPCVLYSASVSQSRHDSIYSPPLAYQTAHSDFVLELDSVTGLRVMVRGHDVALFNMTDGLQTQEHAFPAAPHAWQSFVLAHLLPAADASAHFGACKDLGSGAALEFRECVLLDGARVTCVGEVARDCTGKLGLYPLRPGKGSTSRSIHRAALGWLYKLLSWAGASPLPPDGEHSGKLASTSDGLVGRVMVSEDASLQQWQPHRSTWFKWWAQLGRRLDQFMQQRQPPEDLQLAI